MVKRQKLSRDDAGPSVVQTVAGSVSAGRSRKCGRRKRLLRVQVVRMLSQKQAEVECGGEGGSGGSSASNGSSLGGSGAGTGGPAVTPGCYTNGEGSKEFLSTGRTGRRNALPDILGQHADTDTADLPSRLEALTTDSKFDQPGTSGMGQSEPSTSQPQHTG